MPFPPPAGSFRLDFRGFDLIRSRDCVLFLKDDVYIARVDDAMLRGGWPGGQGVQWVNSTTDDFVVSYSSGLFGGCALWGSDESADQYTAMTGQQIVYGYTVVCAGSTLLSTSSYERYTYASRIGGGPLVPLVYNVNDITYFSLRGLWTKEDELTLSGSPLAPAFGTGRVAQLPMPVNQYFLGIQGTL